MYEIKNPRGKMKIIEVKRICGKCWEEEEKITPMYKIVDKDGVIAKVHQHKSKIQKGR